MVFLLRIDFRGTLAKAIWIEGVVRRYLSGHFILLFLPGRARGEELVLTVDKTKKGF